MRTWLATSALTCCVIQSRTLFCASCACAGVATLPVPIAHTRSYAITTRFQSDTSFKLAVIHTVTSYFQSATYFMLPTVKLLHYNTRLSGTTWVSQYQKGKTYPDFTEARDSEWQWHQLGHMQVCTSLQTDNHAITPQLSYFTVGAAGIPAVKEPSGLDRQDGKRPDGLTLIPWHGGRSLVWDVTVASPLAASYVDRAATDACTVADSLCHQENREILDLFFLSIN